MARTYRSTQTGSKRHVRTARAERREAKQVQQAMDYAAVMGRLPLVERMGR